MHKDGSNGEQEGSSFKGQGRFDETRASSTDVDPKLYRKWKKGRELPGLIASAGGGAHGPTATHRVKRPS